MVGKRIKSFIETSVSAERNAVKQSRISRLHPLCGIRGRKYGKLGGTTEKIRPYFYIGANFFIYL